MPVIRLCLILCLILLLWTSAAFAQDSQPSQPCERDPKPHRTGGFDADVIRCMLFRQTQRAAQLGEELDRAQALYDIQSDDFKKLQREKERLEGKLRQPEEGKKE